MQFVATFIDDSEHYAAIIEKGHEFAIHFHAMSSFKGVKYICPTMGSHGGILQLSLFEWKGTYQGTIDSKPLEHAEFDLNNGFEMLFEFSKKKAGEYLLVAHDGTLGVGFCGLMNSFANVQLYENGCPIDGSMEAYILFTGDQVNYFGRIKKEVVAPFDAAIPAPKYEEVVPVSSFDAVDGLGRVLPTKNEVGAINNKAVGLFFWDWHYHFSHSKPYNIHELTTAHPEIRNDFYHPIWEERPAEAYFWNEPIWGYYSSWDKYVLRKQAQMLSEAGVDFIVFDNTNGTFTWKLGYQTLLDAFAEARADGVKTPQIVFMLNFAPFRSTWVMLREIYTDIYRKGKYQDLWYYYDGKPLVIAHNDCFKTNSPIDKEILDFFTFRRNDPIYFTKEPTPPETWGWLSMNPQARYCVREDGSSEQMTVGIALNANITGLVPMNDENGGVYGRSHSTDPSYSYTYKKNGEDFRVDASIPNSHYYGIHFQEQFDYAIEKSPDIVFVTGWNEWVAGRHKVWQNSHNAFPDEYNDEFSRDIEPSKGELQDHYYMQLCANIRRFKGASNQIPITNKTIGALCDWDDVKPICHYKNATINRDTDGWQSTHYINFTMNNDIAETKSCFDDEYIYLYAKCRDKIADIHSADTMRFLLNTDYTLEGWQGFDYAIDSYANNGKCKITDLNSNKTIGECKYTKNNTELMVAIPRKLLNENGKIYYKVIDNISMENPLNLYTDGCSAPFGRFMIKLK